jgi:two-component system cell cycle sensor histidine kinase/response regulator CckA
MTALWRRRDKDETPAETSLDETSSSRGDRRTTGSILVVDDEYQVMDIVRLVLETAGYEVSVARDATDALKVLQARDTPFDLAIVDFNLPGIDGRQLAVEINVIAPETGILYVSGQPADLLSEHGVMPDGGWFLQKPFTHADLRDRVAERLAAIVPRVG